MENSNYQLQQPPPQSHKVAPCDRNQSISISSSSSLLTNSSTSPSSSSLTSISTNSPTSTSISNAQSMRSVSICLNYTETPFPLDGTESSADPSAAAAAATLFPVKPESASDKMQLNSGGQPLMRSSEAAAEAIANEACSVAAADAPLGASSNNRNGDNNNNTAPQQASDLGGGIFEATHANHVGDKEVDLASDLVMPESRLERSNSCSQAETGGAMPTIVPNIGVGSVSHESLAANQASVGCADGGHILEAPATNVVGVMGAASSFISDNQQPHLVGQVNAVEGPPNQRPRQPKESSTSARFFSSKLNTGSLWSLLSVGSNNSTNEPNDSSLDPSAAMLSHQQQQQMDSCSNGKSAPNANQPAASCQDSRNIDNKREDNSSNNKLGSFFSRVHFKRNPSTSLGGDNQPGQQQPNQSTTSHNIYRMGSSERMGNALGTGQVGAGASLAPAERSRFRFNLKYIGSALLHKNFTLPMLEWIAKDIRRQTVRGAQSTSHRQFTIPARDIVLEIQSYQLTAISCKDGHCIFVHPMPCVSKYAQLQHDPTCFSYLIRDNKESPLFCHVFQAKSAHKVHDIFRAIREATTQTQICQPSLPTASLPQTPMSPSLGRRQTASHGAAQKLPASHEPVNSGPSQVCAIELKLQQTPSSAAPLIGASNSSCPTNGAINLAGQKQQQPAQQQPDCRQPASQFENSYQFEVMFVKKVKLQCRRVPASFVDDAIETLKSFEVLKGGESKAQIKGIGKRIINASVDERQEYDETCQSPTPASSSSKSAPSVQMAAGKLLNLTNQGPMGDDHRRGSSVSLHKPEPEESLKEERESRSCQQSPTKLATDTSSMDSSEAGARILSSNDLLEMKKHQSMDSLKSLDSTIRSAKEGQVPTYTNDFSPYNTITSTDLNERIAAIPVVSSSVSLDHETRQKLARQVRETIMATAANIKKDVYASGDKLDSSASSKALDSLSCISASYVQAIDDDGGDKQHQNTSQSREEPGSRSPNRVGPPPADQRRSSASASSNALQHQMASNNFDLFRRGSARQVVKNRTMLLLIGKDELCTISIDKHQMLFSKSFNSIVHCLQGNNNKDHFGLICRDSGKINPNTESYTGFIFKCQSDKVVREIMGALKQVIYSSQHNYHGFNSPYNPLNAVAASNKYNQQQQHSPKPERAQIYNNSNGHHQTSQASQSPLSLATKRGFLNPIEVDEAARQSRSSILAQQLLEANHHPSGLQAAAAASGASTAPVVAAATSVMTPTCAASSTPITVVASQPAKNLIKSMFCDNCPLYWYHRLCCDIESLPAEASKAIILRRIDSSLGDKEQDELYSRFSEFNIESIEEHNEIFMSLLRHQCEKKQAKHCQSHSHLESMAKNSAQAKQQSISSTPLMSRQSSLLMESSSSSSPSTAASGSSAASQHHGGHSRSGSSSGSLAFVIGQANANQAGQSIADAGSAAMDNLKKAKNSISSSIENILKRRQSMRDEQGPEETLQISDTLPTRSGSFKTTSREARALEMSSQSGSDSSTGSLKRSQSTSDYSKGSSGLLHQQQQSANLNSNISWKDSLSQKLNDDLANPLVGLFRRRNSLVGPNSEAADSRTNSTRVSTECLSQYDVQSNSSLQHSPKANLNASDVSRIPFVFPNQHGNGVMGGISPSSVLSSGFWKKSIFDKIRQPIVTASEDSKKLRLATGEPESTEGGQMLRAADQRGGLGDIVTSTATTKHDSESKTATGKRSRQELRSLWRKAINEQITLLKMEKQNQRLQANSTVSNEYDIKRIKLNYKDISYPGEMPALWDKLLKQDPTKKVEFVEVARMVRRGVPKQYRGEIWMFLMNQYQLRHGTSFQAADGDFHGDANQTYRSLLSQLSVQQHDIFVDIGRTFPSHPYYSQYLGLGQLSLFNLLKAYSLLDQEVGYCQGLSFVAGILLLHVDTEDEAFELMRHLLFNFGLRKQYLPSMNALHLQLYQITRLLRDYEYDLFNHFDHHDISPSLYAAPWFLTLFASQFPLGFVTRLFDLISLIGIEAIFRVSLNLLAFHRGSILSCTSLESTMEYMKSNLVKIDDNNLVKIFDKSMSLDLRNKLIEYEIEYTFYCAEDKARSGGSDGGHHQNVMQNPSISRTNNGDNNSSNCVTDKQDGTKRNDTNLESTSDVADATATVIIQHLLANNHLKSLRTNYSY